MHPEEHLILAYKTKRANLENEEDQIQKFQRKGDLEIEQLVYELDTSLRNQELDGHAVSLLRQELYKAQESYNEIIRKEKHKCRQKLEDNELDYRKNLSQLN